MTACNLTILPGAIYVHALSSCAQVPPTTAEDLLTLVVQLEPCEAPMALALLLLHRSSSHSFGSCDQLVCKIKKSKQDKTELQQPAAWDLEVIILVFYARLAAHRDCVLAMMLLLG